MPSSGSTRPRGRPRRRRAGASRRWRPRSGPWRRGSPMRGETNPTCLSLCYGPAWTLCYGPACHYVMALPGHYVMALPGHYVMALPCHYYGHATMLAMPLCCDPACHYVMAHGEINHSKPTSLSLKALIKGFQRSSLGLSLVSDKMPFGPRPLISFRHEWGFM